MSSARLARLLLLKPTVDLVPADPAVPVIVVPTGNTLDDLVTTARANRPDLAAQRAFLAALGADCRSPVAALATEEAGAIHLRGELLSEDGRLHVSGERFVAPENAEGPALLAADLLGQAPAELRGLFAG